MQTNKYLQHAQPWDLAEDPEKSKEVDRIIYLAAESLRICGILLQPYMPATMAKLLDMLGVSADARKFEHTFLGSDSTYGTSVVDLGKGTEGVLFPPLRSDQ